MIIYFIATIENNAVKSGKMVYSERMNEMESKAVEAIISPSSIDKMTSCSSLTCKCNDDSDDIGLEKQKIQSRQRRQAVSNDLTTNGSTNILEDVVRCLLEKDTSALGFQVAQRSDGICISYVEPNGPADRSGNIFVGDKIKELTITFENMPISDALIILSCASTYKIRLELERAIINDAIQPNYPETEKYSDISSDSIQQFSTLYKSYSTSDLALRLQKAQMFDKAVSGGSFMSKQKYQLPRRSVINTIKEETSSIPETPVTLSPNSPRSDFTEDAEFVMTQPVISEETIVISDPFPILRSLRTSPSEMLSQPQIPSCAVTSGTDSKSKSNSASQNTLRQQLMPQILPSSNEHSVLPLIPQGNHKVDEINCNGFSEFVERSHFIYSNANIKDGIRKNCVEFCELIEPKRDSIVIEFEENQGDNSYQQTDQELINLPNCNGTFHEAENNLHKANFDNDNNASAPIVDASNNTTINGNHTENDTKSENISNVTNAECNNSNHPIVKIEASDNSSQRTEGLDNSSRRTEGLDNSSRRTEGLDNLSKRTKGLDNLSKRTNVAESKFSNFKTDNRFSNNHEEVAVQSNHIDASELNGTHIMESSIPVLESPLIPRKTINDETLPNETNQRSSKQSQLRKLSGNYGTNEVRKVNGITDDLKDEGNNKSNIPQRSPKWSPKLQSHIPVVTRTPSTKSKSKLPKVEGNKVLGNTMRNKTTPDDTLKNDMNGASLYIAKKEALRKTYLPFSKINKSEEMDLNKERKARLEANQALLQRQQDELRTLGILP
ncbi:unnamed protein product [Brugia pahangi]|uniref:PDZ domain-containing protein n=1 Tax=Brugia pahangi TaxID=6280 RepID=A0A158PRG4_BRUPA|nr:unnamed protein product [Brugia pahangi]